MRHVFLCLAAAGLLCANAASAADLLPLKHGRYVRSDTACMRASRADTVPFDGRGFDLSDNGCRYRSKALGGGRFEVAADCTSVGEGKFTALYEVLGPAEFRMQGQPKPYRWCAPSELPAWTQAVKVR